MPASEPAFGHAALAQDAANVGAYSQAPGDGHNRAAQAGHAAAHNAEAAQHIPPKSKSKRVDEANLAKLVAEENASRSKFPRYPGLERWELLEKMGDGAFSNVYRARDTQGQYGEVGIKVVRKYEMNSMQVCAFWVVLVNASLSFVVRSSGFVSLLSCHQFPHNTCTSWSLSILTLLARFDVFTLPTSEGAPALFVGKQAPSSGF
jgi:hypothetical protein